MGKPINRAAKGARLEKLAKEWLEAQGSVVELCPNQIIRIPDKRQAAIFVNGRAVYPLTPIAVRRDFWGCWDGIGVSQDGVRFVFQVGVWEDAAHKRIQVGKSPFRPEKQDMILLYVGGRNRHFKVLRTPGWQWEGECLMPPEDEV